MSDSPMLCAKCAQPIEYHAANDRGGVEHYCHLDRQTWDHVAVPWFPADTASLAKRQTED